MPRIMGDATHANAATLAAALPPVELVAGYVTGSADVQWTASDWAMFTGKTLVTIDQGYQSALPTLATVRDVEPGAWSAAQAVGLSDWNAARPTIYCDQAELPAVLAAGWQRDLWLAITGWQPGDPLPATPGCTIVAVQDHYETAFDLSYVLDPAWPATKEETMLIVWGISGNAYLLSGGRAHHITSAAALALYQAAGVPVAGAPSPAADSERIDATEEAALLADFPAGHPAVTLSGGTFTVTNVG